MTKKKDGVSNRLSARKEFAAEAVTEADFSRYLAAANDGIAPYDLEIRSNQHQITQDRVYAFINSTSDALAQLATHYSADEISYLKRLLDAMFERNNTLRHEVMAVSSTEAINLSKPHGGRRSGATRIDSQTPGPDPGISGLQAQRMLDALVAQGWFECSRRSYFTLAPRALIELRGWLFETYNDEEPDEGTLPKIKTCYACKEIVTMVRIKVCKLMCG